MKLKDFPSIFEAMVLILSDQPYPWFMNVHIMEDAAVPSEWEKKFATADKALHRLRGKTLEQAGLTKEDFEKEGVDDCVSFAESAFAHVCVPINDLHKCIYRRMDMQKEGEVIDEVLYAFFDGDLRNVFQSKPIRSVR